MQTGPPKEQIEGYFQQLCVEKDRRGVIGFVPWDAVRLLPEQRQYLQEKLKALGPVCEVTAVSLGLFYCEEEILAVPAVWTKQPPADGRWNDYAHAYQALNDALNHMANVLAARFSGVSEQATVEGWAGTVGHVTEYFPHCVSHRAFAEAAGLGWRGRHGLIVTPEAGPALRFATLFVPGHIPSLPKELAGCGDCRVCLDVCPILREAGDYREACRRRIQALRLEDEVCGICVRVCWEQVTGLCEVPMVSEP